VQTDHYIKTGLFSLNSNGIIIVLYKPKITILNLYIIMRKYYYILSIVAIVFIGGCKDNTTQPYYSLTSEINDARPYKTINIRTSNGNTYTYGSGNVSFKDAYARDGFFIVVLPTDPFYTKDKVNYYNLSTAKEVQIDPRVAQISIIY
jgi:hypothetical protein